MRMQVLACQEAGWYCIRSRNCEHGYQGIRKFFSEFSDDYLFRGTMITVKSRLQNMANHSKFTSNNSENILSLEHVYEIIRPHILTNDANKAINRLFRRCYFKNNITLYGKIKAYGKLIYLPYLVSENTKVELSKFRIKDVISFQPDSFQNNRRRPFRHDTPIIIICHRGVCYRVDGGKRLRYLHFELKRKTIDALLVTVVEERSKLISLSRHLRDRITANLPSWS